MKVILEFEIPDVWGWGAYHNEWGYASGRATTISFLSKEKAQEWIDKQSSEERLNYRPMPIIDRHDRMMTAKVLEVKE